MLRGMIKFSNLQYAKALLAALGDKSHSEQREAIKRFLILLRKNRDMPRLALILKETDRQELHERGMRRVQIESAAKLSGELKREIEKILGKNILLEEKVKSELLAGMTLLVNDETLIDASGRRQLGKLLVKQ